MTIRHMEILKAISETGSFTKAARLLYITQSAVISCRSGTGNGSGDTSF